MFGSPPWKNAAPVTWVGRSLNPLSAELPRLRPVCPAARALLPLLIRGFRLLVVFSVEAHGDAGALGSCGSAIESARVATVGAKGHGGGGGGGAQIRKARAAHSCLAPGCPVPLASSLRACPSLKQFMSPEHDEAMAQTRQDRPRQDPATTKASAQQLMPQGDCDNSATQDEKVQCNASRESRTKYRGPGSRSFEHVLRWLLGNGKPSFCRRQGGASLRPRCSLPAAHGRPVDPP